MEKVIADVFLIISLILGTGASVRWVHDEARLLLVKSLTKKQPSLSSYTKKLTSQESWPESRKVQAR